MHIYTYIYIEKINMLVKVTVYINLRSSMKQSYLYI